MGIPDGTGELTPLPAGWPSPKLEGQLAECSVGDDELFAGSGTDTAGEESGDDLRPTGNCNQIPTPVSEPVGAIDLREESRQWA